jgi:hypothetical protein
MATTFLTDIESFFSSVEQSIAGKLSGATADTVKKVVATAAVAQHLSSVFAEAETTWSSLDGQSEVAIASSVKNLVTAGEYEQAAFGLLYLVYQGAIEATSKVTTAVEGAVASVVGTSSSATAGTANAAADTSTSTTTNNGSVLQSVEGELKKVESAVVGAVETVVQKAENLVGLGSSTTATAAASTVVAAAVAPNGTTATPVTAAQVSAPVVAAANPPVTATVTQASPIQAPAAATVVSQNNPM